MPENTAEILAIDPFRPESDRIARVAQWLRGGQVAGVPTDTIYGLAANPFDVEAVERVYAIKERDGHKPLSLMVSDVEQARELSGSPLPEIFFRLARQFWPGPLTMIIPAGRRLSRRLTAGGSTVAVRQPDCPIVLALIDAAGFPVTATSANQSGEAECRSADEVAAQLGGRLALIVDGGPSPRSLPSTMLDLSSAAPVIVRPGAITEEELRPFLTPE